MKKFIDRKNELLEGTTTNNFKIFLQIFIFGILFLQLLIIGTVFCSPLPDKVDDDGAAAAAAEFSTPYPEFDVKQIKEIKNSDEISSKENLMGQESRYQGYWGGPWGGWGGYYRPFYHGWHYPHWGGYWHGYHWG